MAMLFRLKLAVPVFFRVTAELALVDPRVSVPKATEVGDSEATGANPVPVRLTVCGLLVALSVKETAAVREPVAVGVKVTPTVQLAPTTTPVLQLLVCAKSLLLVPVMVILVKFNVALPLLVTVTF